MFQFLKKHAAAAKEGAPPEGAAPVSRSAGDRLDSSLAVSVGLCVLVFIVLQWMGSYSPHWGKSIWHHVSAAFLLFSVTLALELRDQDGDPVTVGASDSLTVSFFDASHAPVHTFQFDRVTGGQATLTFDDTVSAKFPKGAYFYDILYTHGDKTTLARDNRAAAE